MQPQKSIPVDLPEPEMVEPFLKLGGIMEQKIM